MKRFFRLILRVFQWASMALAILFVIVYATPLVPWYAHALMGPWNDADGDILVVLSAEVQRDDMIGLISYWRAVYAARAFRTSPFRTVVFTGGSGGGHQSMAKTMADFASCYGVPGNLILLEEQSTSTHENALFTKRLLLEKLSREKLPKDTPPKVVLLTSDYHMFRAVRAFRAVGLAVEARPIPDMLKSSDSGSLRWTLFLRLGTETIKIAYYWFKGWI